MSFTHLHVHSHYSLLDGLPKIGPLVDAAKNQGMDALALTDHGALYGAIEFYETAKRADLKPIIGLEAYVAPGKRTEKNGASDADYFHLVLLAENLEGYKNLIQLVTRANFEGYYYKPRIDKELLREHAGGLVGLSGCLRGEAPRAVLGGRLEQAEKIAREYESILGKGNFFLEIQRAGASAEQDRANEGLAGISKKTGIGLVATADSHYLNQGDKNAQDILVCIGTGTTVNDPDRLDMRGLDLHLASPAEMEKKFADLPEAIANTAKIADRVNIELPLGKRFFPAFETPENLTADKYLEKLCFEGFAKIQGAAPASPELETLKAQTDPEVRKRLDYELEIIRTKGYSTYFLVVADFVNWSRARGIISTTRGSAAGSLVAYSLGITAMNPLEYKLPFERFLNLYRPTPPDIDMDFADNRRDEVLQYVSEKYGQNKVAQIVTFGTLMARAAVRDVGRALGAPYAKCDKIAKMIPFGKQGFHMTIEKALSISPDLKSAYEQDAETKNILELAKKVEGAARHASVHAAGVVIAPTQLTDFTPLQLDTDNRNVITQYDMHAVETAGLVKMDFLGIRNLSILGNAVEIVNAGHGTQIDLQKIPLDDKKTFELLASGRTMGVFQLGGSGMTKYLVELKPTNIFDIMAMISLYRPGPMESIPEFIERKHHPEKISCLDPRMKEILDTSYGVITYQDDVLLIAINLAGYTWEEADKLRKAMGKKILKEMAAQKEKFIQGAIAGGMPTQKAVKLWTLIEPFAAYGFNKSHAASYGIVAYQTAYMKANYPVEFMAAVMTAEAGDNEKIAQAVAECVSMGISVLPPNVNESLADFTVTAPDKIRFGLNAVKNLGSDVIATIISERAETGRFESLVDFARRMKTRNFNKKSWEALAKSGALDQFGERSRLLANTENILAFSRDHQKLEAAGQSALFAGSGGAQSLALKDASPASERDMLAWEKELLGLYVSSHPLKNYRHILENCSAIKNITSADEGRAVVIGGILSQIKAIVTKKGDQMCFASIEDTEGKLELVVFPNVYSKHRELLENDRIILVRGKVSDKDGEVKILVDDMKSLDDDDKDIQAFLSSQKSPITNSNFQSQNSKQQTPNILKIRIPKEADPEIFNKLKYIFKDNPGDTAVSLVIPDREGTPREIKTDFKVDNTDALKTRLKTALRESIRQA